MAQAFGKVIERDLGFNKIRDTFRRAGQPVVKVGIQAGEAKEHHTGDFGGGSRPLTNLEVGVIHEFGAPGASIPERSFIRAPAKANLKKYFRTIRVIVKAALAGIKTVPQGLELLGLQVEADMKKAMDAGLKPPLKQSTVAARARKTKGAVAAGGGKVRSAKSGKFLGKPKPLLDTGQLRNSITHVVVKGLFG